MGRALKVWGFVVLAVCALGSAASAATINEVLNQAWDPTVNNPLDFGFGNSGWFLTWSNLGPNNEFLAPGSPQSGLPTVGPNPPLLNFTSQHTGIGGGGGGGDGGILQSTYTLGSNCPDANPWSMTFSMLFFDPEFAGTGVDFQILGSAGGNIIGSLTAEEVQDGKILSWDIAAAGGEEVFAIVTPQGDQTYPAGFFMNDANFNCEVIPEPATLGLLAVGLAALVTRRRK